MDDVDEISYEFSTAEGHSKLRLAMMTAAIAKAEEDTLVTGLRATGGLAKRITA